jgi:hypothetical protein
LVAAALGLLLGVLLTLVSTRAASFVTPEDPARGFAIVALMMGVRFVLAILALLAYTLVAPERLIVFGSALVVAFLVGLVAEALKMSRTNVPRTSA